MKLLAVLAFQCLALGHTFAGGARCESRWRCSTQFYWDSYIIHQYHEDCQDSIFPSLQQYSQRTAKVL